MNAQNSQQVERGLARIQANREELVERILHALPEDGVIEPLKGVFLARASAPREPVHSVVKPSFCVIAQGSKEVLLGGSRYHYDASHYLITTVELPRASQILEASIQQPYLSFRLELTPALVGSVMAEAGYTSPAKHADVKAIDVSRLDVNLQDAVLRLVRLLDTPAEVPVLLPLITREIVYRLMAGEQGDRLLHLALTGGYTPLITRAVERIRQDFDQPLRVADLARELGMSISGLHHHFKAVTAMSPLQYQKQIRLQEARRLLLSDGLDAASTAFRLGYHDASHFNREYKSFFGAPPQRDVRRLRDETLEHSGRYPE